MRVNNMIITIDGKIIKDIDYIQITYGSIIDFRKYDNQNNETIVYTTNLKDKMVFINNSE